MQNQPKENSEKRKFISSRGVFNTSLWVFGLTTLIVFLEGIHNHRSLFENSLITTSLLSLAFFLFITIGLYQGAKLKDDVEKTKSSFLGDSGFVPTLPEVPIGEGIGGIVVGILLWILVAILIIVLSWLFSVIVFSTLIIFMAMLYWIFFRAIRLVFKNSYICKKDLVKSISYGLFYTVIYNFWIYGIIIGMHSLR